MSKMEKSLKGVYLDAPARVGVTVFNKGVSVLDLVTQAQAEYARTEYRHAHPEIAQAGKEIAEKPKTWMSDIYAEILAYNKRTGKKVYLEDIYEAFFVTGFSQVEEDDREAFLARVRERLAE